MNSTRLGIVIQARTGSSRLRNKILLNVSRGKNFFEILLDKLASINRNIPVIIATSTSVNDDLIEKICQEKKYHCFRGSEENVLERVVLCATKYKLSSIVRICSDNPFIDLGLLEDLINQYNNEDYFSYLVNGIPAIKTHYGFFAEIVSLQSLKLIHNEGKINCAEHVTNCVYTDKNRFLVRFIPLEIEIKNVRCTLDTKNDFENLIKIYNTFLLNSIAAPNYIDILNFVKKSEDLTRSMKSEIIKNFK